VKAKFYISRRTFEEYKISGMNVDFFKESFTKHFWNSSNFLFGVVNTEINLSRRQHAGVKTLF